MLSPICVGFLCVGLITLARSDKTETITQEWIFQFDVNNKEHWNDYQIRRQNDRNDGHMMVGESSGCTSVIPVVFKKLCVDWNDKDGFSFRLKRSNNEKVIMNRRLIINTNCYWYNEVRACGHIDPSNEHSMTVAVGINEDYNDYFGAHARYNEIEYSDYYDEYNNDYYDEYELWTQYLNWQWRRQQYKLYNSYMDAHMDSDDKEETDEKGNDEEVNEFGISEGSIIERAEAVARRNVEKKLEERLEGKFEREMMNKLEGKLHKKASDSDENQEAAPEEEDIDDQHSGIPSDEMNDEQDRNEIPPHDSLSDSK